MERYTQQVKEIIERSRREEESLLTDAGKAAIEIVKFYKEKGFYNTGKPVTENKNDKISY